jgi:aspartate/methionine/tyrosine aminotransferase
MYSKRTDWKLTPNRFSQAQAELRAAGTEVLDLSVSNPTRAGLQLDQDAILHSLAQPEALDYDPQPKGLLSAREAVARYYKEAHGIYDVDPESLILRRRAPVKGTPIAFRLLCNPTTKSWCRNRATRCSSSSPICRM